ncbi:MAG TPA: lipid-A-disaccharide synthase [Gemmatimonadales bacterium]|nr:lipid-A-disaccharide synthase [Gemmatimonadales bacterium]
MSGSPPRPRPPRIYVSAGEPSGDAHAAQVVAALRRQAPGVTIDAFGGPRMEAAGARVLDRMETYSVVGFVEAVESLPRHYRLLRRTRAAFRAGSYDVAVFVDYPGYHLRAAAAAAAAGVPVLYYIAPQLWAWGAGRVRRLAQAVRQLAVILPFEEPFFREHGVPTTFVGHPLKDRMPPPSREAARRALGIEAGRQVLGVFPGSRAQEVRRIWPVAREAARLVRAARPELQVLIAGTPVAQYADAGDMRVVMDDPALVFAAADAGLCKSGTTTLEAALADLPMVITYRLHPLSNFIARRLLRVPWVGLVNLVAGELLCPELLQGAATPRALADALLPLLDPADPATRRQRAGLATVRERLGDPGAAERVASLVLALAS